MWNYSEINASWSQRLGTSEMAPCTPLTSLRATSELASDRPLSGTSPGPPPTSFPASNLTGHARGQAHRMMDQIQLRKQQKNEKKQTMMQSALFPLPGVLPTRPGSPGRGAPPATLDITALGTDAPSCRSLAPDLAPHPQPCS